MDIRNSITVLALPLFLTSGMAIAEFPPLPEETEQPVTQYPEVTNRWQGNYPELENALPQNPWGGTGPIVREPSQNQFASPKHQFAEPDYSPYEEGNKRFRTQRRGAVAPNQGLPPQTGRPYPGYGNYYPPGGYNPNGGYGAYPGGYPGGWPGGYGSPWSGGGWPFDGGSPWNNRGGNFPMSPFNW